MQRDRQHSPIPVVPLAPSVQKKVLALGEVDLTFVLCTKGTGRIGSEAREGRPEEYPIHKVEITHSYWLAETPVTQHQWNTLMGKNPSQFEGNHLPVEGVTWIDAVPVSYTHLTLPTICSV